jgi:uncharacterized protein (UPF0276 family)
VSRSLPARAGIGLRAAHHEAFLAAPAGVPFVEVHSENFFADGGPQLALLDAVRGRCEVSLHGVGLSLGSVDDLDRGHLAKLRRLVRRVDPCLVSEHLSWSSAGGIFLNDLLPLPYTAESLRHVAQRVSAVQDELGQAILVENISAYLQYGASQLSEAQFLAELVAETGCGILLDVNNLHVNARNLGWDAGRYLAALPLERVAEIHLAGHSVNRCGDRDVLIDTHDSRVCDDVWALYSRALAVTGPVPTLIEWDTSLPALEVLLDEARTADRILEAGRELAA